MCAVLFKGDCGWEEEKDPDLCYAMLFVQIENSCFFPDIFVCLPELMLILKNRNMLGKRIGQWALLAAISCCLSIGEACAQKKDFGNLARYSKENAMLPKPFKKSIKRHFSPKKMALIAAYTYQVSDFNFVWAQSRIEFFHSSLFQNLQLLIKKEALLAKMQSHTLGRRTF